MNEINFITKHLFKKRKKKPSTKGNVIIYNPQSTLFCIFLYLLNPYTYLLHPSPTLLHSEIVSSNLN